MNTNLMKRKLQSNEGNCLVYGCASLVVISIIGVVVIGLGLRSLYSQFRDNFTDDVAMELPIVEVSDSDRDAIIERYDTWVEAIENDGDRIPLTLTEEDINVLIQNHDKMKDLNGKVYVSINDTVITGDVSIPLEGFLPGFSGRYFNGSADFEIELENGRFSLYATAASVKGESLPDNVMDQIKNENLAKEMNKNSDTQDLFEHIESIEVKDGVVTIVPMSATDTDSENEERDAA